MVMQAKFGVQYVHAWHSLYGYWAGIATGNSKEMPYNAQLVVPRPTPGILEIDPCFAWQQQVLVGVGVAEDVRTLYKDMHSFLAGTTALLAGLSKGLDRSKALVGLGLVSTCMHIVRSALALIKILCYQTLNNNSINYQVTV